MSQEIPDIWRFLAIIFGCNNQMTIILEKWTLSTYALKLVRLDDFQ